MSWEVVSCWIESHPGLASWVQALGSIAAIAAAGYFPIAHERRRENRERKNMLRTLGYVAYTLGKQVEGLAKALANKELHRDWCIGAADRKIRIIGQALNEIPASLLVGVELHLLADLRFSQECAVEIDGFIRVTSPDDVSAMFEVVHHIETCEKCTLDIQLAQETLDGLALRYA